MVRGTVRRWAWLLGTLVVIVPIFFAAASIGTPGMTTYVPAALPLTALALGFGVALSWRRQVEAARRRWASFELVVSENVLRRTVAGASPVEILRPDVVAILERPNDGLILVTTDRKRSIVLPPQLLGYAELRDRLVHWRPIERTRWGGIRYIFKSSGASKSLPEAFSTEIREVRAANTKVATPVALLRRRPTFGRLAVVGWFSLILLFALIWIFVPK
jgi:hypothetical protein